ncbi:proenkephalin-B [Esox lucius]|nr:proenkephalin-B [Esox lucius]
MEWYVLVLVLSLPSSTQADCSSQCLQCALQILNTDIPVNSLTCTLECEGTLLTTAELHKCGKTLQTRAVGFPEFSDEHAGARSAPEWEDGQDASITNEVKGFGGFIKRIDENKNKLFTFPWRENGIVKGSYAFPTKYEDLLRKFGERDLPEFLEDDQAAGAENEVVEDNDDAAINKVKRYGGFLRKFGPKTKSKRSDSREEGSHEELQKRYGGFMRRIRPKLNNLNNLKWDNQKRYGGFLRRHYKLSVRSDEEPYSYDDFSL